MECTSNSAQSAAIDALPINGEAIFTCTLGFKGQNGTLKFLGSKIMEV